MIPVEENPDSLGCFKDAEDRDMPFTVDTPYTIG
jgi:hypothetical protein